MKSIIWRNKKAWVEILEEDSEGKRHYQLNTTAPLKDQIPENGTLDICEKMTFCRSSSPLFDALFCLAWHEAEENKVSRISDWSFEAEGIEGFETGRKWNYIWTRDTAYSADLGLGIIDPKRLATSLLFKISAPRSKKTSDSQIIQDTGSGGSWPISTDRVVWSLGADRLLSQLSAPERKDFLAEAYTALKNTLEVDRNVIFDAQDGLYRGEQSFLDWREQTYPRWTANDTLPIANSKSLSTNICHYISLKNIESWGKELGKNEAEFNHFTQWAKELKQSINKGFWNETEGLYRSILMDELIHLPLKKYDLLGNALAIIYGVAEIQQAEKIISHYPHSEAGAPVVHPQLPDVPVYHNRAIWPFVSAYALEAAKVAKNMTSMREHFMTLIRGAALNLSNMENFEFTTLSPDYQDPQNAELNGPVVNSQRQLWSVAAYLNMTLTSFFGLHFEKNSLKFDIFLPCNFLSELFTPGTSVVLNNLQWKGKKITLELLLPNKFEANNYLELEQLFLNNKKLTGSILRDEDLVKENKITIILHGQKATAPQTITKIARHNFCPPTVAISEYNQEGNDKLKIRFSDDRAKDLLCYKNGQEWKNYHVQSELLVEGLRPNDQLVFTEKRVDSESHPSIPINFAPNCVFYPIFASENISNFPFALPQNAKMAKLSNQGFEVSENGTYQLALGHRNIGPINTGITAALRKVELVDVKENKIIATKVLIMPHHQEDQELHLSSEMTVTLERNKEYCVQFENFPNMSSFAHFEKYTKRGGKVGEDNVAEIFGIFIKQK